ncbi:unnamed protein product [Brachionus calyciflorus]|uniref:FLYWCH-type domain-containing protein n=1 Tax=Brachionus calyciflorus TaxID=104777 RepID=A0A814CEX2_9BILA|nr:unnamed protein product [Brachionus calyciflorus]
MAVNNLIDQLNNLQIKIGIVTASQRGHPQLCVDNGYFFRVYSENESKICWRCIEQNCKAKCVTQGKAFENEYQVSFKDNVDKEHTHGPKPTKFELKEKRRKLKEVTVACSKVVSSLGPRQILTSVVNEVKDPEAIANMPSYNADRQCIQRYKKKNRPDYPPEPKTLADIEFPVFLTETLENHEGETEAFLLYDSGKDDPNRFFIIATKKI